MKIEGKNSLIIKILNFALNTQFVSSMDKEEICSFYTLTGRLSTLSCGIMELAHRHTLFSLTKTISAMNFLNEICEKAEQKKAIQEKETLLQLKKTKEAVNVKIMEKIASN